MRWYFLLTYSSTHARELLHCPSGVLCALRRLVTQQTPKVVVSELILAWHNTFVPGHRVGAEDVYREVEGGIVGHLVP